MRKVFTQPLQRSETATNQSENLEPLRSTLDFLREFARVCQPMTKGVCNRDLSVIVLN